jgi:hypothetical protein
MSDLNTNFWNERYAETDYVYGKEPNEYLKQRLAKLAPGKILFPCEGEGRNSVYAAELGWESVGFDTSLEGQKKALLLADEKKVNIHYSINSITDFSYGIDFFNAVGIFYCHLPSIVRQKFHHNLIDSLAIGGAIIMEVFDQDQLGRSSGGPKDIDMLCTPEILAEDFKSVKILELKKEIINLNEGKFHNGEAVVIRMFARK